MARYTSSYNVELSLKDMMASLKEILQSCCLNLCYETEEYIMAKEEPGNVSYTKLVEVEILIDRTKATATQVQVDFVVKNEELPLQVKNHCREIFEQVQTEIKKNTAWKSEAEITS
jgi:hypothetical protein